MLTSTFKDRPGPDCRAVCEGELQPGQCSASMKPSGSCPLSPPRLGSVERPQIPGDTMAQRFAGQIASVTRPGWPFPVTLSVLAWQDSPGSGEGP